MPAVALLMQTRLAAPAHLPADDEHPPCVRARPAPPRCVSGRLLPGTEPLKPSRQWRHRLAGRPRHSRSERGTPGWLPEQRFRRLHPMPSNTPFLVLPGFRVPNLASRILGLSERCLSSDVEALRGHPVLKAETFLDPTKFWVTCYTGPPAGRGLGRHGASAGTRTAGGSMAARKRFWCARCVPARGRC